jgi:hypothetical protein
MNDKEFRKLKQQYADEYREKIAALKLVYYSQVEPAKKKRPAEQDEIEPEGNGSKGEAAAVKPTPKAVTISKRSENYGNISKAVKEVINGLPLEFLTSEVIKNVHKIDPSAKESSVSGALRRMSGPGGVLTMLEKGRGKKQSKFRKN